MDLFAHCEALVRERDEDRWLAARYAPPEERRRLMALAAVRLEIERVPAQVREPPLGEIRLQWWRDGLAAAAAGRPPPHPSLQAFAAAKLDAGALQAVGRAIDARARLLYGDPFVSADDLASWLETGEAFLALQSARLLGADIDAAALNAAALGYTLARARLRAPEILHKDVSAMAERQIAQARGAAAFPAAIMPAIAHLTLASAYLRKSEPGPIEKRVAILRAVARGRL